MISQSFSAAALGDMPADLACPEIQREKAHCDDISMMHMIWLVLSLKQKYL